MSSHSQSGKGRSSPRPPPSQSAPPSPSPDLPTGIPHASITQWRDRILADPVTRLAVMACSKTPIKTLIADAHRATPDYTVFSVECPVDGTPVTDQKGTSMCWIYAITNILRTFVAKKYGINEFQLSQGYLFFYDHLAKANWFLEQMIDLADRPITDRSLQYLFKEYIVADGGQYDMAVGLLETYGMVPLSVYPSNVNTLNSVQIDEFLNSKLRGHALDIREAYAHAGMGSSFNEKHSKGIAKARGLKLGIMKEVYKILAIACGVPLLPSEPFKWTFVNTSGQVQSITTTPLSFYQSIIPLYRLLTSICMINDPRNRYATLWNSKRDGNIVRGRAIKWLNVDVEVMKNVARKLLEAKIPVWFACNVEKGENTEMGLFDDKLYQYSTLFGTSLTLSKAERLETGDGSPTHAMIFTGVHVEGGKTTRWKVENSWGERAGIGGFFTMSDEWFSENVYQLAALREYVPKYLLKVYDHGPSNEYEVWDPMG